MFLGDSLFFTAGIFGYFLNSNIAGQLIVIVLLFASLVAWTLMLGKRMELKKATLSNKIQEKELTRHKTLILGDLESIPLNTSPYARLVKSALSAYYRYGGDGEDTHNLSLRMGHVENALQRAVAEQTLFYESKMVILGSIVTGAPFCGLLGTVWGVMDAFGSVSGSGGASIQNLAPGVSGSLLTTVAGLLVAIPSVFGYNYLLAESKMRITELENFASVLADRIELDARSLRV
jgi:biopolymer transport protein TolQ|tara:strand:+ start:883 stop:1584 length:702 start_codon:yes stop_codon:yes gene_type:complete